MSDETLATMDCAEIMNPDPIIHLTENGVEGFEVLCRLCANRSDHLIPIYSEEGVSNDLADKMNMYLPIKVTKSDLLPLQCCFQCATTVLTWHELVVATLEADRRLRDVQIEVEKQLLPGGVDIPSEPAPGTSQETLLKNEGELILPHAGDEDDDEYNEVTVLYVEDQEMCDSLSSQGQQLGDQEEVNENLEKKKKAKRASIISHSDQKEEDDNSEEEKISQNKKKKAKIVKTENDNTPIEDEESCSTDGEYYNWSDSSSNTTKEPVELIDFEEEIKNTVVAVCTTAEMKHECEICSKKFLRLSSLDSHINTHVSDFFCHVCCKSFNTLLKLDCHLAEHPMKTIYLRKEDPAFMICKKGCVGKFYSKLQLYHHNESHSEKRHDHICGECGKGYNTFNKLVTHKKSHKLDTPKKSAKHVKCAFCNKTYSDPNAHQLHLLKCRQKRIPVQCKTCGASFRHQGLLTNHETIHSDNKKYVCAHCSKTFGRSNYLKDHLKSHFISKPFKCEQCDGAFSQKNILVSHIKMKHRVCGMCDKNVGDALQLRVHLWKYHGREDPEFEIVEIQGETYTSTSTEFE